MSKKTGYMDERPLLIYDETFLLKKIRGRREFRLCEIAILFIKEGQMEFVMEGTVQKFTSKSVSFVSPRNIYRLKEISEDVKIFIVGVWMSNKNYTTYNFNRFNIYHAITIRRDNVFSLPKEDFDSVWRVLEHIHYHQHQEKESKYSNEIILHAFSSVAYSIVEHFEKLIIDKDDIQNSNSRKEYITMKFMELASDHFLEEKELRFYADQIFISVKYLSICVKDVSGYPPTYYLNQLLINEACRRLAEREKSIGEVAYGMGFADQFVFSKFFKKHVRMTPSDFRKEMSRVHTI